MAFTTRHDGLIRAMAVFNDAAGSFPQKLNQKKRSYIACDESCIAEDAAIKTLFQ